MATADRIRQAKWRRENPDVGARWAAANRDRVRAIRRRYQQKHRARVNAAERARRAAKLRACPVWADRAAILRVYEGCPSGHHVDHVVPLRSPVVCGLHCEANLQYLPARDNRSKNNRFWPDMPE